MRSRRGWWRSDMRFEDLTDHEVIEYARYRRGRQKTIRASIRLPEWFAPISHFGRSTKGNWASPTYKRAIRNILWPAQDGICAGCGLRMNKKMWGKDDPSSPTLDHIIPRSQADDHTIGNLLLKHKSCNEERSSKPATGCDRIWQLAVMARITQDHKRASP